MHIPSEQFCVGWFLVRHRTVQRVLLIGAGFGGAERMQMTYKFKRTGTLRLGIIVMPDYLRMIVD
jgi:hypothetical protein